MILALQFAEEWGVGWVGETGEGALPGFEVEVLSATIQGWNAEAS